VQQHNTTTTTTTVVKAKDTKYCHTEHLVNYHVQLPTHNTPMIHTMT